MSTVHAPYASELDTLAGQSIVGLSRATVGYGDFINQNGDVVSHLMFDNPASSYVKALRRLGSFDSGYRDVLIKDWAHPNQPTVKLADPATPPTGLSQRAVWSPDGAYLAVGSQTAPYLEIYKFDRKLDTFAKLASPPALPGTLLIALAWSPDGQYLFGSDQSGAHYMYYKSGDNFYRTASPAPVYSLTPAIPGGTYIYMAKWSRDGTYLAFMMAAITDNAFKGCLIYKRDSPGVLSFTKLPDIPALSTAPVTGLDWSPDTNYLAVSVAADQFLRVYKRNGDVFSPLDIPGTNIAGSGAGAIKWSLDGSYLAMSYNHDGLTVVWQKTADAFTQVAFGETFTTNPANALSWSPDGRYLAVGHAGSPFVTVSQFTPGASPAAVKLPNPNTLPPGICYDVSFAPDGRYLACVHASAPYVTVYKSALGPIAGAAVRIDPNAPVVG